MTKRKKVVSLIKKAVLQSGGWRRADLSDKFINEVNKKVFLAVGRKPAVQEWIAVITD